MTKLNLPVPGVPLLPKGLVAPEPQTLRFVSRARLYGIPLDDEAGEGQFEGLDIRESFKPKKIEGLPKSIGEYTIGIEKIVHSSDEMLAASHQIRTFAAEIDKFWIYACGEPFEPVVTRLSFDRTLAGWDNNETDIRDYLLANCRQMFAVMDSRHQHWLTMPYYPLRPALRAREAYRGGTSPARALADLHYGALKSRGGEGRLFAFAKALELARKILPGRNDDAKQSALHPQALEQLKHSLHWLMDMANNRYHTRHAVKPGRIVELKPPMTGTEAKNFEHDADIVLRATVCSQFRIPYPPLFNAPDGFNG